MNKTKKNLRNKTTTTGKDYLARILKTNIYSYTKDNDDKIYVGPDLDEIKAIYNGNVSSIKKESITIRKVKPMQSMNF